MRKLPSATILLTIFRYKKRRGVLLRGSRVCGRKVSIQGIDYWTARVIWKMVTGMDPAGTVDHRNGNTTDFRWNNLRDMDPAKRRLLGLGRRAAGAGGPGVSQTSGGRWRAVYWVEAKRIHIGYFPTRGSARAARAKAVRSHLAGR